MRLYHRLSSTSLPALTEDAAAQYLSTHPYSSATFYPSSFSIAARSLSLTSSYFHVQSSTIVQGEKGLILRRSIPPHRQRIFVGFYLGWTHREDALAPFTSPDQQGIYSLQLPHTSIVTATPTSAAQCPFILARANEWIWDPSYNQLTFDSVGRFYLNPSTTTLRAGTEVCVCLGTQGNYSWHHYMFSLYQRLLKSTIFLASIQHKHDWATTLHQQGQLEHASALRQLSADPTRTIAKVLLAIVEVYARPLPTATLRITPDVSLLQWLQTLPYHSAFSSHHTFRKADLPSRPFQTSTPYDILQADLLPTLSIRPILKTTRPRRTCIMPLNYCETTDLSFCQELADQPYHDHPLRYVDSDLPYLMIVNSSECARPLVPSLTASSLRLPTLTHTANHATQDCPSLFLSADISVTTLNQATLSSLLSPSFSLHVPGHDTTSSTPPVDLLLPLPSYPPPCLSTFTTSSSPAPEDPRYMLSYAAPSITFLHPCDTPSSSLQPLLSSNPSLTHTTPHTSHPSLSPPPSPTTSPTFDDPQPLVLQTIHLAPSLDSHNTPISSPHPPSTQHPSPTHSIPQTSHLKFPTSSTPTTPSLPQFDDSQPLVSNMAPRTTPPDFHNTPASFLQSNPSQNSCLPHTISHVSTSWPFPHSTPITPPLPKFTDPQPLVPHTAHHTTSTDLHDTPPSFLQPNPSLDLIPHYTFSCISSSRSATHSTPTTPSLPHFDDPRPLVPTMAPHTTSTDLHNTPASFLQPFLSHNPSPNYTNLCISHSKSSPPSLPTTPSRPQFDDPQSLAPNMAPLTTPPDLYNTPASFLQPNPSQKPSPNHTILGTSQPKSSTPSTPTPLSLFLNLTIHSLSPRIWLLLPPHQTYTTLLHLFYNPIPLKTPTLITPFHVYLSLRLPHTLPLLLPLSLSLTIHSLSHRIWLIIPPH